MKKYLSLGVVVVILAGGVYFTERAFLASSAPATDVAATTTETVTRPAPAVQAPAAPLQKPVEAPAQTPNIRLTVAGTSYGAYVPAGATVLDAMKILVARGELSFTSKDFPGMGAFIESINGKQNADGSSWFLYVNGTSSDTGASQATLKAGDVIEWRYEKNY